MIVYVWVAENQPPVSEPAEFIAQAVAGIPALDIPSGENGGTDHGFVLLIFIVNQ
jgi:hypothetical protein